MRGWKTTLKDVERLSLQPWEVLIDCGEALRSLRLRLDEWLWLRLRRGRGRCLIDVNVDA